MAVLDVSTPSAEGACGAGTGAPPAGTLSLDSDTPTERKSPMRPLLSAALLAAAAPAGATNLFSNASFESPSYGYAQYAGGSAAITGWTTVLSGVEHYSPSAFGQGLAADGQMAVDLANYVFVGGGIEQTVATVAGQSYDVSFWAGNSLASGRDGTGIVKVSFDSTTLQFATAVATSAQHAWALRSFSFVASGSSTTIRFWNDQNPLAHFALIDGVGAVPAVPEPGAAALMVLGLAGVLAARRRLR